MIRVAAVVGDCGDFLSRMITNDEANVDSWITMNCFSSCFISLSCFVALLLERKVSYDSFK
jgi:hypothetical protein